MDYVDKLPTAEWPNFTPPRWTNFAPPLTPGEIRVFISSPSDVGAERRRAALVCNRLSREIGRFFEVRPVIWEYETMLAAGHFQDVIEPAPSDTDIVALILWSQLGTPLPVETDMRRYEGIDGRSPVTGTEWVFEDALRARQERMSRGKPVAPELIVYKSEAEPRSRANSADGLRQAAEQLEALQPFWQRHFETLEGQFKLTYATYGTADAFEARFEEDLRSQPVPERGLPAGPQRPLRPTGREHRRRLRAVRPQPGRDSQCAAGSCRRQRQHGALQGLEPTGSGKPPLPPLRHPGCHRHGAGCFRRHGQFMLLR